PNSAAILDFGITPDQTFYLVMEFLDGLSLRDRLRTEGKLPPQEVVRIISQVCDALNAAHSFSVIHRDLKPENIFLHRVDGREVVKILDFGIAKVRSASQSSAGLTTPDTIVGTPFYMSPEQCLNLDL